MQIQISTWLKTSKHQQITYKTPISANVKQLSRRSERTLRVHALQSSDLNSSTYMEEVYDRLALKAIEDAQQRPKNTRHIIGIAGVPGGGKSTLAAAVTERINHISGNPNMATRVPMDGFHYYRKELDAMPNPTEAHARRGAHWTFDAQAYVQCLKSLKYNLQETLKAPTFDHGVGDPHPDAIEIHTDHCIVLSEGNYLLLDVEPWSELVNDGILDDSWFVECDIEEAMRRVFVRQTGNGIAPEVSQRRIATNDRPNAEEIIETEKRARLIVPTKPFRGS